MSIATLQADLRSAVADRDAAASKLADLMARQTAAETARDEAEQAAVFAERAYKVALGADDLAAVPAAKAERARLIAIFDDWVLTCQALAERVAREERELGALQRGSAYARERVAIAVAAQRELELRAAAKVFAEKKRRWHQAAAAASDARYEATGNVGIEPVQHTGFQAALLIRGSDEGLRGILSREGIAPNLQPNNIRAMSERELLALNVDDETTEHQTANDAAGDFQ